MVDRKNWDLLLCQGHYFTGQTQEEVLQDLLDWCKKEKPVSIISITLGKTDTNRETLAVFYES